MPSCCRNTCIRIFECIWNEYDIQVTVRVHIKCTHMVYTVYLSCKVASVWMGAGNVSHCESVKKAFVLSRSSSENHCLLAPNSNFTCCVFCNKKRKPSLYITKLLLCPNLPKTGIKTSHTHSVAFVVLLLLYRTQYVLRSTQQAFHLTQLVVFSGGKPAGGVLPVGASAGF